VLEDAAVEVFVDNPAGDVGSQGTIPAWEAFFVREEELFEVVFEELVEGRSPGTARPVG